MMRAIPTAAARAATVCARAATAGPAPAARAARVTASTAAPHPAAAAAAACAAKLAVASRSVSTVSPCEKTANTLTIETAQDKTLFMRLPSGCLHKSTELVLRGNWDAEAIKHLKLLAPNITTLTMPYVDMMHPSKIFAQLAGELTGVTTLTLTLPKPDGYFDIGPFEITTMAPDAKTVNIVNSEGFLLKIGSHNGPDVLNKMISITWCLFEKEN